MTDDEDAAFADWLAGQPRRRRITPAEAASLAEEIITETREQIAAIVELADRVP